LGEGVGGEKYEKNGPLERDFTALGEGESARSPHRKDEGRPRGHVSSQIIHGKEGSQREFNRWDDGGFRALQKNRGVDRNAGKESIKKNHEDISKFSDVLEY